MSAQPLPLPDVIVIRRVWMGRSKHRQHDPWLYYVTTAGAFTGCGTRADAEDMADQRQQETGLEIVRIID